MHITEFTRALADLLPGWQPDPTAVPIATDPASDRIWDSGPLPYAAFETDNIQRSVLTHHWGLQLYVMPRPHRLGEYLALPMLPANTSHQHVTGLRAPRGIAVPADPVRAAARLHRRLLTDYRLRPTPIRRSSPGHLQVHVTSTSTVVRGSAPATSAPSANCSPAADSSSTRPPANATSRTPSPTRRPGAS
ncbi:hypothetical protein O1M63_04520 [Streptomyces mirabilis]|nr:hypothetical protein [Streptomyces mirabilis]